MKTVPEFWFEPRPWVDGKWVTTSQSTSVNNPATGVKLADVSRVDIELVNRAILGAVQAQKDWSQVSAVHRGNVLKRSAFLLLAKKEELACLLSAEQGKPYSQSLGEVEYAASFFQWFGEEARRAYGRIAAHPENDREFLIEHKPIGVAGLITPWNFPLAQGAKKIAAALAAGCSAVWKPAERTPLIALAIAPLLAEAGIPTGVLQITPGPGGLVGQALADHPAVRVLSLTGSTATGSILMAAAAPSIKRVSLELGGNAPFILLPDADLELAAEHLVTMKLFVSGQVCVTCNRVFVHASVEDKFTNLVAKRLSQAVIGNGLKPSVNAGPLISHSACEGVRKLVQSAVAAGAKIVVENKSYEKDPALDLAGFYPPTLLTNVQDDMELSCNEIFGPIIPFLRYSSVGEVIGRANDTPYGLAGYVYGRDLNVCRAVATQLEVGIVGVNEWRPLKAEIPFGGIKQSGIGAEGGEEGLREFLTTQVISIPKPSINNGSN